MNSESFLPILLESLVKGSAILLAAALLDRAIGRASAACRHLVWAASFGALALLPLTKFFGSRWQLEMPRPPVLQAASAPSSAVYTPNINVPLPATSPSAERTKFQIPDKGKLIIGAWLIGAVALIGYRALGSLRLWQMKRRSSLVSNDRLIFLAQDVASAFGIARPIQLRTTSETSVPITWGSWRPVLMLPARTADWDDRQLIAALRHEFGHILRYDHLTRLSSYVMLALHWPNPLVWLAARRLRLLQEQACDDLVLCAGTHANDYATLLTDAARAVNSSNGAEQYAVAMARPSTLEHRVVAILDDDRNRTPAGRLTWIAATTLLALTLTASTLAQVQESKSQPLGESSKLQRPGQPPKGGVTYASRKAKSIKIPRIDFRNASLKECLDFLAKKSREFDPEKEGLSFVIPLGSGTLPSQTITLSARDVSLLEAAKQITAPLGLKPRVEPYGIAIVPLDEPDTMYNVEYKVPPDFVPGLAPDRALSHFVRATRLASLKVKGSLFQPKPRPFIFRQQED